MTTPHAARCPRCGSSVRRITNGRKSIDVEGVGRPAVTVLTFRIVGPLGYSAAGDLITARAPAEGEEPNAVIHLPHRCEGST